MNALMKHFLFGLTAIVTGVAGAGFAAADTAVIPELDRVCMVQDTVMAVPAVPVQLDGKTYYGCCEMCKGRIVTDPKQYTLATDPVSGRTVDKATAALASVDGAVFYFETAGNRERFAADPAKYAPARKAGAQ